jgi:hypothetical protein
MILLTLRLEQLAVDHHYHGETKCSIDDKPYDFWKVICTFCSYSGCMLKFLTPLDQ